MLTKGEHHTAVAGNGKESAVPHADYNQCEQHNGAVLAEDVEKDLEDWLPSAGIDSLVKVLDGK